jgi:DNA-binding SARP family transcriptional activator
MSQVTLSLLGNPQLERDGMPTTIDRHKALALLAYLAVTAQPHRRDALATMFWQDFDQTRARAALRRALASLNKAIPGAWWQADRETITLKSSAQFFIDTNQFRAWLSECNAHGHAATETCSRCLNSLTQAVALYRGDFLSGFTLRDSPNFDDWQFNQTEIFRRELSSALERLSRIHASQHEFEFAIRYAKRWLTLDQLNEGAHRQLMSLYAQAGERHSALRQYADCVRTLEQDLGLPPQDETTQLYEAIKADTLPPLTQPTPAPTPQAFAPHQAVPLREEVARTSSPFERLARGQIVGREHELAQVSEIWERVNAGEARVLFLSGEPGIGKTRLAREIISTSKSSGVESLTGECFSENNAPYAPIAQILRNALAMHKSLSLPDHILADLIKLVPELAERHPNLPIFSNLDAQSEQRRLFEGVTSFIASFAQTIQTPLVIFIEDAHWADTGTLFLLRHLAQRATTLNHKLLLVITYRDAEADLDEARGLRDVLLDLNREHLSDSIRLPRLDRENTNDLLSTMLGSEGGISADFLNAIFAETEGNPFFIEETCRALIEAGNLYYAGGHWRRVEIADFNLPPNVRGAILSRVQKLPQDVQDILRLAAIHGREFDAETLHRSSEAGQSSVFEALEQAERAQLIIPSEHTGIYAFTHALVPFALRESLSGLKRQRLHEQVAEAIEDKRPDDIETIAYHYVAAGLNAKAVEYSLRAAERAENIYAYDLAIQHKQTALDRLEARDVETRLMLLEGLADLHLKLNQNARAIPMYLEALQLWRGLPNADIWNAVRLQRKIGEATTSMNQFADYQRFAATSRSSLEAGLELIQNQPPHPETIRLLLTLSRDAWYIVSSADWDAAERYAQSAVTMAEALDAPVELSSALESLSIVHGARGQFRERVEVCQRRLELSRDPRFTDYRERVNVAYQLGRALLSVGEYETALTHAKEAENLSAAIQDVTTQVNAMTLQSQCMFPLDRWDDLLEMDEKLRDIQGRNAFERLGIAMCFHTALISAVKTLRGEREQADSLREEAYTIMTKIVGPPERWVRNQRY